MFVSANNTRPDITVSTELVATESVAHMSDTLMKRKCTADGIFVTVIGISFIRCTHFISVETQNMSLAERGKNEGEGYVPPVKVWHIIDCVM